MLRDNPSHSTSFLRAALFLALAALGLVPLAAEDDRAALNRHLQQAQIHLDGEQYKLVVEELQRATAIHALIPGAYYQLGLAHWHLNELDAAKSAFLRELEFEPPDAYSLYYLGRIGLSEGNVEDAVQSFERVLKIGTILDVRSRLASGYLRVGRIGEAVSLLEETVRRWPEQGNSHYLLGRAYQRQGRTADARYEFELAERWKNKVHSEIQDLVDLRVLLLNKRFVDAAAKARGLAESGDPDIVLSTAIALGQHGFHGEALPMLRRVVESRPTYSEAYYNMALAQVSLERPADAVPLLERAIELRPELYEARMLLGNLLVQADNPEKAIPHLRAAAAIRPDNAKLAAFLGLQYLNGRYYQEAVTTLRRAAELDPASSDIRFLLVDAHYKNHDFERALEEARSALDSFPDLPNSHYQVAWQLENMGQFPQAKRHLEDALQLDARFTEARRLLGEIELRLGNAEGSLEHFRGALAEDPQSAAAYAGLGKALIQLRRYEETIGEMEKAIEVAPELASLRLYLSQAYRAEGRMDEAKREAALFTRLNRKRAEQRDRDVERTYVPSQAGAGRQ